MSASDADDLTQKRSHFSTSDLARIGEDKFDDGSGCPDRSLLSFTRTCQHGLAGAAGRTPGRNRLPNVSKKRVVSQGVLRPNLLASCAFDWGLLHSSAELVGVWCLGCDRVVSVADSSRFDHRESCEKRRSLVDVTVPCLQSAMRLEDRLRPALTLAWPPGICSTRSRLEEPALESTAVEFLGGIRRPSRFDSPLFRRQTRR